MTSRSHSPYPGRSDASPQLRTAWQALTDHAAEMRDQHLASLFAADTERFARLSCRTGPLLLDYSKQRLTTRTLEKLIAVAAASDLGGWTARLFEGDAVNTTEQRAAMHWALRLPPEDSSTAARQVHTELERMSVLVERLHAGQWRGANGEVITDVVNIGVGGSDLGPMMLHDALVESAVNGAQPRLHFVSSMDGSQLSRLLPQLRPQNTLFLICSKSFTTIDTLSNAMTARSWLVNALGDHARVLRCHFIGISASAEKMTAWGIPEQNQLRLWDWVGGRFSLWSSIGFAVALRVGMAGFRELLAGAHAMDRHFREAPWAQNLPVLLALIGVWNSNCLAIGTHAVLPYDGRLAHFPAYLSQLEMESNGKSVTRGGTSVTRTTCPVIWGDVGPNAQHAFYQLLHQGTQPVSCDFIVPVRRYGREGDRDNGHGDRLAEQHQLALANCLAQSRLLALGEAALPDAEPLPLYRRYFGNQPSCTLLLDEITPYSMGMLIAAYEHKVFVQSVIWNVNPFDQWGVEMGKLMANETREWLRPGEVEAEVDSSTAGLIAAIKGCRG